MKKQLLLGAALAMGFLSAATAQETIYSQDFEGGLEEIQEEGWEIIGFHGGTDLSGVYDPSESIEEAGFTGKTIGSATFTISNAGTPTHIPDADSAIQSPAISIPDGIVELSYRVGAISIGGQGNLHYSVYAVPVEALADIEDVAELKDLLDNTDHIDSATIGGESSVTSIIMSAFAGQDIKLFFRLHESQGNAMLLFDDINVSHDTMGTEIPFENQFAVYPNPATNVVTISSSNTVAVNEVSITDMGGRLISGTKTAGGLTSHIDVLGLSNGVYLMTINTDKGSATKKIVIKK